MLLFLHGVCGDRNGPHGVLESFPTKVFTPVKASTQGRAGRWLNAGYESPARVPDSALGGRGEGSHDNPVGCWRTSEVSMFVGRMIATVPSSQCGVLEPKKAEEGICRGRWEGDSSKSQHEGVSV